MDPFENQSGAVDKTILFQERKLKTELTEEMNLDSAVAKEIILEIFKLFEKACWI